MGLKSVRRNPVPLRTKRTLRRIRRDQFSAAYAVSALDLMQEFEVLQGEAA